MPSQYLPYAFLLFTLILAGPQAAIVQATGLVAAHIYDLLTGLYPSFGIKRNFIPTPGWVRKMFGTQGVTQRTYGTGFAPPNGAGAAGKAAWGLDLSWRRFGEGRRLGGEGESSGVRQRPRGLVLAAMVMVGVVLICGLLGFLFYLHQAPDGGWFAAMDTARFLSGTSPGEQVVDS
jgi:Derlin-2/3